MDPGIAISLCVVIVLTCMMAFILGHRLGAAQMERLNKQHAEMLAATVYLLANGVRLLPEDEPTDEKPKPKVPNLLLFKRGEGKVDDDDTPPNKE